MEGKRRVMVVDDEKDFLVIIKINLEKTGKFEVETISDATSVVSQVKAFNPDIILLDILMPKMDGVEVCRMLNQDSTGKRVPIITLSALDTDKDKLMMYKLGVVDFLVKPIEKDELISKIEKALQYK
ncbi:MAG: response regulator [Candidatus Omnitrophica bacterium]|nr:response regulator [Candidatus Omnitrophota bacterium]